MSSDETIPLSNPNRDPRGLEAPGAEVGPYKLISQLGEGGFGTVWLAERRQPFVQRVALKIIKPGMDSKAVIARFEQERQALAVMAHPGIARVLDGGLTPQGRPYFVMEYVRGKPITEFADDRRLAIRDRLALFAEVCEAVQHAHLKGIIHRDLKPSNILAFDVEGGVPGIKVIDFGVAKATQHTMAAQTVFTETGQMIGTPEYMSPEQADPTGEDIDTRSDVYSLGVILYELLAGVTPIDPKELRAKAYREQQRIIAEGDMPTPSTRLSTVATKDTALASRIGETRREALPALLRHLRRELEWIPLKAMRRERQERYQSATDLARDIRNYLDGRPLVAGPESSAYRVRKFMRRHRGAVVSASLVAASLVVGLGIALWQWREAAAARDQAELRERQVTAVKDLVVDSLVRADPMQGGRRDFTVKEAMQQAIGELGKGALKDAPDQEIVLKMTIAQVLQEEGDLATAIRLETEALATLERVHGADASDAAIILNNLATLHQNAGNLAEAERLLRRAVDLNARLHGPEHRETVLSTRNLAGVLQDAGRLDEAASRYEWVLAVRERTEGADSRGVALVCNALGSLRADQKRPADAEALFRRAAAIQEKLAGAESPFVGVERSNLGGALCAQGKLDEADRELVRAAAILEKALGPTHGRTRKNLERMAELRRKQGRDADAAELEARAKPKPSTP